MRLEIKTGICQVCILNVLLQNNRNLLSNRLETVMSQPQFCELCEECFRKPCHLSWAEPESRNSNEFPGDTPLICLILGSDFGTPQNKICHCFLCFPIYLPWSYGISCHGLFFWMLSFKPAFSLSFFTFIKRLFSSSSLSAIRVMSSAYLRLLIFLPTILIPACASSSLAFHMKYSAYKLNKQGDNN